jgi:POT family proton-dependent oligopeptide transporter
MQAKTKDHHTFSEKQPAVIPVFFATEMWERFGFYMIQALLVLYMTSSIFGFSDAKSYAILGAFSAISYITPIFGGYIASRILDFEHAVTLGGFLLAIGYALLSLPHEHFFYVALAIISIGNGFFKPNISSYLGDFYHQNDSHREKGYTIFYVGINVGALLSSATSGYLVRYFGWHVPFLIASIGLLVGTVTFVFGLYYLKNTKSFHRIKPSIASKNPLAIALVYISAIILTIISYEIIRHRAFANVLMLGGGCIIFAGLIAYAFRYQTSARNKMLACIFLTILSIVFWAIFFQMFFSMNLFIERAVGRHIFDFVLPTPLFISLESIFIVLLGPLFAILWQNLSKKRKNPGIPVKFTYSLFALAIAFAIAYIGTQHTSATGTTNMLYIVFAYLFITIGELLLSPVGLAMVTVLMPQELVGLMMGVWFVALGLGEKLAGVIAGYAAIPKHINAIPTMDQIYGHAFLIYIVLAMICGIITLICVPLLNKLIAGKK